MPKTMHNIQVGKNEPTILTEGALPHPPSSKTGKKRAQRETVRVTFAGSWPNLFIMLGATFGSFYPEKIPGPKSQTRHLS